MMLRKAIALCLLIPALGVNAVDDMSKETVILVHGIMNKPVVMTRIANALENQGYRVHNWGYASTSKTIEAHAQALSDYIGTLGPQKKIHFVGFSQGSIILRYLLVHHPVANAGRFVMIAPPNHGCEMAEDFYRYGWFRSLYGDQSIKQLFVTQNTFLEKCGIPTLEFGIIAGGLGNEKGFSSRIPGDDDSTLSVASTHLTGERDFILLPHKHTPLVWSADTVVQVGEFLREGRFKVVNKEESAMDLPVNPTLRQHVYLELLHSEDRAGALRTLQTYRSRETDNKAGITADLVAIRLGDTSLKTGVTQKLALLDVNAIREITGSVLPKLCKDPSMAELLKPWLYDRREVGTFDHFNTRNYTVRDLALWAIRDLGVTIPGYPNQMVHADDALVKKAEAALDALP